MREFIKKLPSRLPGLAALLLLAWLALPGDYVAMARGLDQSWAYAINAAGQLGLRFGHDLIFTYGPLGCLAMPMAVGGNLVWAFFFNLALHGLLIVTLGIHAAQGAAERLVMFAAAWLMLIGIGLPREYQWLLLCAMMLGTAWRAPRHTRALAAAAAILAAVFLHIKFSLGVGALATLLVFHALNCIFRHPGCWRRLVESAALLAAVGAGLMWLLFDNFGDYRQWLRGSLELTAGYSSAMAIPGPGMELAWGLLVLAMYAASLALALARDRASAIFLVLAGGILLTAFKHGFVRQDAHVLLFFTAASGIIAAWLLFARRGAFPAAVAALLVSLALALAVSDRHGGMPAGVFDRLLSGQAAMAKVDYWRDQPAFDERFRAQLQRALQASAVDAPALAEIRAAGAGVDALPWELSCIPANRLRWRAQPLLQFYSAYTPWLDRFAAAHYTGADAPEFVLLHYGSLDGRYLAWDAPLAWRTLLRYYAWHADLPAAELTILRRRPAPLAEALENGAAAMNGDAWLEVPESASLLFANLDLPLVWRGRAMQFFFRLPPLRLEVEYNQGQRHQFQLTPAVAGHGVQINYLPDRYSQLAQFWQGAARYRVRRVRLTGPGRHYYPESVRLQWRKLPWAMNYQPRE